MAGLLMIASVSLTTATAQETDVRLTKAQSVKVIQDLIACDYIQKEVKIILNTLDQKDIMLVHRKEQIAELENEIQKRDHVMEKKSEHIEVCNQLNEVLGEQLRKARRQNRFFSLKSLARFSLGVLVGVAGGQLLLQN